MTYLVHGATGAQGFPVVSALLAAGDDVVAVSRRPDGLPAAVRTLPASYSDTDALAEAYAAVDGVFVHLPLGDPGQQLAYAASIGEAIARSRPARVVVSSSGQIVDEPGSPLQAAPDSPIASLLAAVESADVSSAVVAPRLFLENLLMPVVADPARQDGVLRYPLPADCPVSWSSHLDVAEVVVRLLRDRSITGTVAVGHCPGLTGDDLAAGFAAHLGRGVRYEAMTPTEFGELIAPVIGADAAGPVVGLYTALGTQQGNEIPGEHSAQQALGLQPLTVPDWLARVGG